MNKKILSDFSKLHACDFNEGFTIDIDYRDYMVDQAEGYYDLSFKQSVDSDEVLTYQISQDLIGEDGALPLWFVDKVAKGIPKRSFWTPEIDEIYQTALKLHHLIQDYQTDLDEDLKRFVK